MDILLYGVDTGLVQAWQERLAFFPELQGLCSIMYGDIRQAKTDAVVSPAMEFQSEGRILGTGAQIFSVAGPVILYGPAAAVLYGLILWIFRLF